MSETIAHYNRVEPPLRLTERGRLWLGLSCGTAALLGTGLAGVGAHTLLSGESSPAPGQSCEQVDSQQPGQDIIDTIVERLF